MVILQVTCDLCRKLCTSYHLSNNKRICFICKPITTKNPNAIHNEQLKKVVLSGDGKTFLIKCGDRFLLHTFKWYVTEFLHEEKSVVVRLEGTADVAILPELLVGILIDEFNSSYISWRD